MPKYKIDDRVIDTTEFIKGTGTITDVMSTPSTGSIRYHVDFKDTKESGWFREEELMQQISELKVTKLIIDILRNKIDSYNKTIEKMVQDIDADDYKDAVTADGAKIEELKEVINQIQKIEMGLMGRKETK